VVVNGVGLVGLADMR